MTLTGPILGHVIAPRWSRKRFEAVKMGSADMCSLRRAIIVRADCMLSRVNISQLFLAYVDSLNAKRPVESEKTSWNRSANEDSTISRISMLSQDEVLCCPSS